MYCHQEHQEKERLHTECSTTLITPREQQPFYVEADPDQAHTFKTTLIVFVPSKIFQFSGFIELISACW
jgi:hypothetical protein